MNLFVLFEVLVWMGLLTLLLVGLLALFIKAYQKRSWKFAFYSLFGTVGVMSIVTGLFFGIHYWIWRPYEPTSEKDLQSAYRADFGALPPSGITVLKCRQVIVGDAGGQWLLIRATPEEIDRHVAMGFEKAKSTTQDFNGNPGGNVPDWWKPSLEKLEIYENLNWSKEGGWHTSEARIGIDREANLIWFVASKWD